MLRLIAVLLVLVTATAAGQATDDAKITAAVKSKLVADKPSNLTKVDVDTDNGVVHLNGSVDTAEQKACAEQLVREASGVRRAS